MQSETTAPVQNTSPKPAKQSKTSRESWVDKQLVSDLKRITKPVIVEDIKAMYRGRTAWRRTATAVETIGKGLMATGTVLAFASASDIADVPASRILAFVSGAIGTLGLVMTSFANFARTQAVERTDAANMILGSVNVEEVPDINDELVIADAGNGS